MKSSKKECSECHKEYSSLYDKPNDTLCFDCYDKSSDKSYIFEKGNTYSKGYCHKCGIFDENLDCFYFCIDCRVKMRKKM